MTEAVPFHEDAERALVARLLLDPSAITSVSGKMDPTDFYLRPYQIAFRTMVALSNEGKPIDIVTLQAAGADVDPLILTRAHRGPLDGYIDLIKDASVRRRVLKAVDQVAESASDDDADPIATMGEKYMELIRYSSTDGGAMSAAEAGEEYYQTIDRRKEGGASGLEWGVPGLDEILLPASGGELIIIAARPSVGKTVMAENIADHWAQQGRGPVLFISLEMSQTQLWDRGTARTSGISTKKIIKGDLTDEERDQVKAAVRARQPLAIEYYDNPFTTSAKVRALAHETRAKYGSLGGIVVDYIQILKDPIENPVHKVSQITAMLKGVAREQDVPLIAMSQFNRLAADQQPQLHHLRESGSIEQDADVVVALWGSIESKFRSFTVLKQRQGKLSTIMVVLNGDVCRFEKYTGTYIPDEVDEEPDDPAAW